MLGMGNGCLAALEQMGRLQVWKKTVLPLVLAPSCSCSLGSGHTFYLPTPDWLRAALRQQAPRAHEDAGELICLMANLPQMSEEHF